MERAETAFKSGTPNDAAGISTIFFIFMYAPCEYLPSIDRWWLQDFTHESEHLTA